MLEAWLRLSDFLSSEWWAVTPETAIEARTEEGVELARLVRETRRVLEEMDGGSGEW